jgi:hypothetical protein
MFWKKKPLKTVQTERADPAPVPFIEISAADNDHQRAAKLWSLLGFANDRHNMVAALAGYLAAYRELDRRANNRDVARSERRGEKDGGPLMETSMKWRPIQEHVFPWEPCDLIIACFYIGPESDLKPEVKIFEAYCAGGDYFHKSAGRRMGMLTLLEERWTPFAWLDTALPPPLPTDDEMKAATEHFRGRLGGPPRGENTPHR